MSLRPAFMVVVAVVSLSCQSATTPPHVAAKPRNVIFIIGDGMGSAQFSLAKLLRGSDFRVGQMPVTGWVSTGSADSIVTDSAAAASAYATGQKVNNRTVSISPAGVKLQTALQLAETTGRATGTITTADFFDATAAAFASHAPSRYSRQDIALQMLQSGAEIVAGGGLQRFGTKDFYPDKTVEVLARENGFTYVGSGEALQTAQGDHILVCFTTEKHEVDSPQASLPTLARWAIDRLSGDRDGFFVMIEHEGIDGAGHNNATEDLIRSVRSVDEVVGIALDFAAKNPDTLVIVTGDHGTGGLQIHPEKPNLPLELIWGSKGHTGEAVPIFASGPGAESFMGSLENSEVGKRLLELLSR